MTDLVFIRSFRHLSNVAEGKRVGSGAQLGMLALKIAALGKNLPKECHAAVMKELLIGRGAKGSDPSAAVEFGEADLVAFEE